MRRLCVFISNCSRLSLFTCGERITQYRLRSVGSGIGPETFAPGLLRRVHDQLRGLVHDLVVVALEADPDLLVRQLSTLRQMRCPGALPARNPFSQSLLRRCRRPC